MFHCLRFCPERFSPLEGLKYTFLFCSVFVRDEFIQWQLDTRVGKLQRNIERHTSLKFWISHMQEYNAFKNVFSIKKEGTVA